MFGRMAQAMCPMMAPFLAPFRSAVKAPAEKYQDHKNEKPQSNQRSGVILGTAWEGLKPRYIMSIITCPNPEHDTWVAPGISRAKS